MNSIEKLTQIFSHFPGIGPRQARRFVYYLLTRNNGAVEEIIKNLEDLKKDVSKCADCGRFFEKKHKNTELCSICSDNNRDEETVMVVPRDIDLESIEKNRVWTGKYFVLGGTVPILEKEPKKKIREEELLRFIERKIKTGIKEIVLAMNWNPEGENTSIYVEKLLRPLLEKHSIKISHLGKGLSMGTELEYTDPDTLKNALKNRS
ncbi:MAG: toprim domain-containing protein [Patescibacteria group bacterium]